ncbi:MAG: LuxR C-terminal-related transcriptional regulator [Planctomycetia bacterium]|nr:LuxR C-terminal-related transcriptional regulator [Planctomycetia bacterium]
MIRPSVEHLSHVAVGSLEPAVYVVHPNPECRRELADASRAWGYRVEMFDSAESFLSEYDRSHSGCLITSDVLPNLSGVGLLDRLRNSGATLPVVVVADAPDAEVAVRFMQRGAITVLPQHNHEAELRDAVRRAMQLDAKQREQWTHQRDLQHRLARLTPAEAEVLELMIAGKANKNIARHQAVSLRTVETRRQQVFHKLEADSLAELILLVVQARTGLELGEQLFASERSVSRLD